MPVACRAPSRRRACRARVLGIALGWAVASQGAIAEDSGAPDFACTSEPAPAHTMMQTQSVTVHGDGWMRQSVREVYWKRFGDDTVKMLFRVVAPPSEQGLKVLVDMTEGRDPVLYVYTPDTGRARRMVGSGASNSVLGTDVTYEDAKHLEHFLSAPGTLPLREDVLDGRPVQVLERRPEPDNSAYGRIVTFVDAAWCVPLLTELYAPNGALVKTLAAPAADVEPAGVLFVPRRLVATDLAGGSRTEFVVERIEIDGELPDRLFTAAEIAKSH